MDEETKHDAEIGRAMRWFARWHGGAILFYLLLICFVTEEEIRKSGYEDAVLFGCLGFGAIFAIWLGRRGKKRLDEINALQDEKNVVE